MLEDEITAIAHDVWETMFAVSLTPGTGGAVSSPSLTSVVHIDGAWQGAVTIHCPVALAAELTTRVFGESSDTEMHDLLGEVVNQLGGNIKAMLPAPCSLSLPAVAQGNDYELRVVDATAVAVVSFVCEEQPLVIALLERTA